MPGFTRKHSVGLRNFLVVASSIWLEERNGSPPKWFAKIAEVQEPGEQELLKFVDAVLDFLDFAIEDPSAYPMSILKTAKAHIAPVLHNAIGQLIAIGVVALLTSGVLLTVIKSANVPSLPR